MLPAGSVEAPHDRRRHRTVGAGGRDAPERDVGGDRRPRGVGSQAGPVRRPDGLAGEQPRALGEPLARPAQRGPAVRLGGSWDAPPGHVPRLGAQPGDPEARADPAPRRPPPIPDRGPSRLEGSPPVPAPPLLADRPARAPMAAVFVWRSPLAVARSLQHRDACPSPTGWPCGSGTTAGRSPPCAAWTPTSSTTTPWSTTATGRRGLAAWLGSLDRFDGASPAGTRPRRPPAIVGGTCATTGSAPSADADALLRPEQRCWSMLRRPAGGHHPFLPATAAAPSRPGPPRCSASAWS